MRFNTLEQWLGWLETLHPKSIELGLERLHQVIARIPELLRLQQSQSGQFGAAKSCQVVTVAGTNGKGSCVATLEALCLGKNQSVGAYSSPHLLHYNERIRVNGEPASDEQIMRAFARVDQAREAISLTYFEFGTLAALLIFLEQKVEVMVLEVGLGGRLDAVNAIDPDVAVVTSIDLDHQAWLGDNREAIGREKAGIFRAQRPAICVDPEPPRSLLNIAKEQSAQLLLVEQDITWHPSAGGWSWSGRDIAGERVSYSDLPLPHLPLPSVAAAIQAFILLGELPSDYAIQQALANSRLPGRCQRLHFKERELLLDVAHNPAAAAYLAERLRGFAGRRILAVFAVMADKDYRSMLETLAPLVDQWFLCALPRNARAAEPQELLSYAQALGESAEAFASVETGLAAAVATADKRDLILVAGSFFTVAEVLALQ